MSDVTRLLEIMARLRQREGGCPWDVEQTFQSIAPHTIEEAYEVADAIERGDRAALREELGDLLFQAVFHARMAEEEGSFAFGDVVDAICAKLVRRHPHVFGEAIVASAEAQTVAWEAHKAAEREAAAARESRRPSAVDDVPRALPALARAGKLQRRMARSGFDWRDHQGMFEKLGEELTELRAELLAGDRAAAGRELGDVLFVASNLARECGIDAETALREANARVEARFRRLEARLAEQGRTPADASDEELRALWAEAKADER
jgi:MazG family protein